MKVFKMWILPERRQYGILLGQNTSTRFTWVGSNLIRYSGIELKGKLYFTVKISCLVGECYNWKIVQLIERRGSHSLNNGKLAWVILCSTSWCLAGPNLMVPNGISVTAKWFIQIYLNCPLTLTYRRNLLGSAVELLWFPHSILFILFEIFRGFTFALTFWILLALQSRPYSS